MSERAYHVPRGNPCILCGLSPERHYPSHAPKGFPICERCGCPWENHKTQPDSYIVGIDGEGVGRDDHKYTLLAWSSESGKRSAYIEAKQGLALSTVECLDFILATPKRAQLFSFSFGYDITKILTDVDDAVIYLLMRPELRPNKSKNKWAGPSPVKWRGYSLNMVGSKFVVERGRKRVVIWDVFRFFQSKFVKALIDWKVEDKAKLARMGDMKDKRADFDKQTADEIRAYCLEECRYMAKLATALTEAHNKAGLTLRAYYGAGSSAAAMLKQMSIDKEVRTGPKAIEEPVASAFFGGRFENSVVGEISGTLWGYDISSAYPYQLFQLPCLGCGSWRKTKDRKAIDTANAALVHYALGDAPTGIVWGPFPFRLANGSIAFPATSGGGWVWSKEFIQAEKMYSHVHFREAWVYHTDCNHRPFERIPKWYVERLRIGKEGPGLVLKLGMNSCYGKLAQSIGVNPPFQSWIWAGMVTSGTRAQLLELQALHKDSSNLLMFATDGVYTRERIVTPTPIDTQTDGIFGKEQDKSKPLGGWEEKEIKQGMFAARPGIYFPLNPTEKEIEAVRARGVGRKSLYQNWQKVITAWRERQDRVQIGNITRFMGAKSSIHLRMVDGKPVFNRADYYGQWRDYPIEMTFDPLPKRERINDDNTLEIRRFPNDLESKPYKKGVVSPEAMILRQMMTILLQQPDGDDASDYTEEYSET